MGLLFSRFIIYRRSEPFEAPLKRESTLVPFSLIIIAIESYRPEDIYNYCIEMNDYCLADLQGKVPTLVGGSLDFRNFM